MKAWLIYSVARIGVFAVACLVLWLLLGDLWHTYWWLGVVCATIIAFCISYIFFEKLRTRAISGLATRAEQRAPKVDVDAAAEDRD